MALETIMLKGLRGDCSSQDSREDGFSHPFLWKASPETAGPSFMPRPHGLTELN
jgi:hypothetical protein